MQYTVQWVGGTQTYTWNYRYKIGVKGLESLGKASKIEKSSVKIEIIVKTVEFFMSLSTIEIVYLSNRNMQIM